MSLQTRLTDTFTAIATDVKGLRSFLTGTATGAYSLPTAAQDVKGAIAELKSDIVAAAGGMPSDATETSVGVTEIATTAEVNTGTDNFRYITPAKLAVRLAVYAQPLSSNLTDLSGQASTAYGRALLALANQAALTGLFPAVSESVASLARIATQAETTTGTLDSAFVTPLKLQQKLTAWAQPLSANLTSLAGVASTTLGRSLLSSANAGDARTSLGLAAVASSGSASDITTGTLPTSVLPALAINDVFTVATQAAMLALTAQRGDVAIRTDVGRTYILATDSPSTLGDWKLMTAGGDVTSVAGRTGAVVLAKADVDLANVDNTSDASKPVSTAQGTAIDARLAKASNLSDLTNAATARGNLSVYSQAEIGNPETDFAAAYATAKS